MKKNVLTLGLIVASAVALGGYSYAAQSDTVTATNWTTQSTVGQWRTKLVKKAIKNVKHNQGFWTGTTWSTMWPRWEFGQGGWFGMGKWGKWGKGMWGEMHGMKQDPAVEAALKANDYNAFVTAFNANTNKPADATVPTQEQFNDMVKQYAKHAAREAAIEANDYNAFVAATTPTQAEFAEIVAHHQVQKAIETAITNKDYTAFVAAIKADTKRPTDAPVPTQEQFNNMIAKKAQ